MGLLVGSADVGQQRQLRGALVEQPLFLDPVAGAQLARGTVGLRIPVARFVCKRKLSQDKDDLSRRQAIDRLREPGPYKNPDLADEMEREWEVELAAAKRQAADPEL